MQLPPSLCLLPHTRLLRHTLARASRQAKAHKHCWDLASIDFLLVLSEEILKCICAFSDFLYRPFLEFAPSHFLPSRKFHLNARTQHLFLTCSFNGSTLSDVKCSFQVFSSCHLNLFLWLVYPGLAFSALVGSDSAAPWRHSVKCFTPQVLERWKRRPGGSNKGHKSVSNLSSRVVKSHVAMRQGLHGD